MSRCWYRGSLRQQLYLSVFSGIGIPWQQCKAQWTALGLVSIWIEQNLCPHRFDPSEVRCNVDH